MLLIVLLQKDVFFFDEEKCQCRLHTVRPYNCRIYGITPSEEFEPRYNRLKELYKDDINAIAMSQCDLVSTKIIKM